MSSGLPVIFKLLGASAHASDLVDVRVTRAVQALHVDGYLRGVPSRAVLAAACLGDAITTIKRLTAVGVLPDELESEDLTLLAERLSKDPGDLNAKILNTEPDAVAAFLGLPGFHGDKVIPVPSSATPAYALFPHQRTAVKRARGLLAGGKSRLLIHMPTGSGKTRTTMSMVCDVLRENEGRAVLWFASTRELLEQAAREFSRAWASLGNRELPIVAAWGGSDWSADQITDGLVVASLQTVYARRGDSAFLGDLGRRLSLIVFDEAHQAIAPTYRHVVQNLSIAGEPITPIVGLSATPGRTFIGSRSDQDLAEFFGHTKVELETAVDGTSTNPVEYLIREGYLARPEFRLLGELPDLDAEPTTDGEDELELGMDEDDYIAAVAKAVLDLIRESHKRIIVFAGSVDLAHVIAATLRAAGVLGEAVDGTTASEIRDTAIRLYKSPAPVPRVLVNYGVLTTGFDAPQTSAVVIARPTRSLVLYSQMVGRGIRGPRAGGNRTAVVVTVVDPSVPAFGSIAAAFTHWEDLW